MTHKILLAVFGSWLCLIAGAQSPVLTTVKIEYEKKVNTWASLPGGVAEEMKRHIPQYSSSFFTLQTNGEQSLYKHLPKEDAQNARGFMRMGANTEDVVFTDFLSGQQTALKSVFEKKYLLTDSIARIPWKITDDFRNIAGFNCRRATAVILDSVFVVAFYTDEILASGGPESFTGLPGTILGLVINRIHTTWYATGVSVTDVDVAAIQPPVAPKAEKMTRKELVASLRDRFTGNNGFLGNFRDVIIWNILF